MRSPARLKGAVFVSFGPLLLVVGLARSSPAASAVAFGLPTANPNVITAGVRSAVMVTVRISGSPSRVWLERLSSPNAPGGVPVANLGGGDGVFSTQVQFNERSPGAILLQVVAGFTTPATLARTNAQTLRSRPFVVRVVQGQQGDGGNHGSSGGGISTGQAVGIGAAIAGAAVAVDWWKHHHDHAGDAEAKQTVQKNGLTLRYPSDWQLNSAVPENGPISLNTFNSRYLQGGVIPAGGADIDVAYLPSPNGSLEQIMAVDLEDAEEQSVDRRRFHVAGLDTTTVSYTDTYTPDLIYRNTVAYVPKAGGLYKFFLSYHKGDPQERQYMADFEQILKSVKFAR